MINMMNCDCMEFMAGLPDKAYELAIVDPPYGIGISGNPVRQMHEKKVWDNNIPDESYFVELVRVSKHQIIWGGNYYSLPPTQNIIVWDKQQPFDFSLAMCEFAWCSIQMPAKIFRYSILAERDKIHPTQKPVALYKWLLQKYAKPGDKILDTHGGSGSICIACYDMGFDLDWMELDADYYGAACERFRNHTAQGRLFEPDPVAVCEQLTLDRSMTALGRGSSGEGRSEPLDTLAKPAIFDKRMEETMNTFNRSSDPGGRLDGPPSATGVGAAFVKEMR